MLEAKPEKKKKNKKKKTNVRSLTSHLRSHPSKMGKKSKNELIREVLLWTPTHRRASVGQPARTYLH